ncbi:MAG: hypothetical protein C0467_17860 [Planctomycetaceae bacterium]|nr:hypothetical protein [Planctomycetaceae bacterium]
MSVIRLVPHPAKKGTSNSTAFRFVVRGLVIIWSVRLGEAYTHLRNGSKSKFAVVRVGVFRWVPQDTRRFCVA